MIPIKTDSAWRGTADCRQCSIRELALFAELTEAEFGSFRAMIDRLHYEAGVTLYSEGESAPGLFTLRAGMLKLVRVTKDGRQRIVRVLRPGDVVGIEALATNHYECTAVAMTQVDVCRLPLSLIRELDQGNPRLHATLIRRWQLALKEADDWLAELNSGTARQRVARLIMRMRNPLKPQMVTLFARDDMGSMLGLTLETVSRELSSLVRTQVIEPVDRRGRIYHLLQLDQLQDI